MCETGRRAVRQILFAEAQSGAGPNLGSYRIRNRSRNRSAKTSGRSTATGRACACGRGSEVPGTPTGYCSAHGLPPDIGADGRHGAWWHYDSQKLGRKSAIFAAQIRGPGLASSALCISRVRHFTTFPGCNRGSALLGGNQPTMRVIECGELYQQPTDLGGGGAARARP